MIIMIPLFKAIQLSLFDVSVATCFGTSRTSWNIQRYLLMFLVAAETVNRTAIACFFYLIATGWGVLRFDYDPLQATNCARFLGVAYLCHSAYLVTAGAFTVHLYLRGAVILFYVISAFNIVRKTGKSLATLATNENYLRRSNLLQQFRPVIHLKR